MSLGVPGARYTVNSKGRKTFTTGIPGTGIYNVETISNNHRQDKSKNSDQLDHQSNVLPKPGIISSKSEKAFYKLIEELYINKSLVQTKEIIDRLKSLDEQFPELKSPLELLAFLYAIQNEDYDDEALAWINKFWQIGRAHV